MRQLFHKTLEFDQELHVGSTRHLEISKKLMTIYRESIYNILEHFHLSQKRIGLIEVSEKKITW